MRLCPTFTEFKSWEESQQLKFLSRKGSDTNFIIKESLDEIEQITGGKELTKEQTSILPPKVRKEYLERILKTKRDRKALIGLKL